MKGRTLLLLALLASILIAAIHSAGIAYSQNCNNFGCTSTLLRTIAPPTATVSSIPPTIITATQHSRNMVSETAGVSDASPLIVSLGTSNLSIEVRSNSTYLQSVSVSITNYTGAAGIPANPPGYEQLLVVNASTVSSAHITANMTFGYQCKFSPLLLYVEELENGSWQPVNGIAINGAACTITFPIPNDPIIGIFLQIPYTTTFTVVTQPTIGIHSVGPSSNWAEIAIIIVILVIILAAIYYNYRKNEKIPVHRPPPPPAPKPVQPMRQPQQPKMQKKAPTQGKK